MLNSSVIRQLRAKAHNLNPVVIVGQAGFTANVQNEIDQALLAHELIKVKVNIGERDYIKGLADEICQASSAELVQIIGRIIVIYRPQPE